MTITLLFPRTAAPVASALLAAALASGCGGGGDGGPAGVAAPAAAASVGATTAPVVPVVPVAATPAVALGTTLAAEGQTFTVAGTLAVRYGAGDAWVLKSVSGVVPCTNAFFGTDPSLGVVKSCQAAGPAPVVTIAAPAPVPGSRMPGVDPTRIPAPAPGWSTARVQAANVADPSQNPVPSDIGDFREWCDYSHMSYDDPIVAPGGVGAHLHVFMGNTGADRNSTSASLATTGNSTCSGGILNRTAYWMPAVIDTRDGSAVRPTGSLMYYKQAYDGILGPAIRPFPPGLRMIAGSAAASWHQDRTGITCFRPDGSFASTDGFPTDCPAGSTVTIGIAFPQCWDGVNLDSPDHRSHMAQVSGGACPATHPVALTSLTMQMNYPVPDAAATAHWRLSSDDYDPALPGGRSVHADWWNGWDPDILATWTARCLNATMDCHAFLIGDGRILY